MTAGGLLWLPVPVDRCLPRRSTGQAPFPISQPLTSLRRSLFCPSWAISLCHTDVTPAQLFAPCDHVSGYIVQPPFCTKTSRRGPLNGSLVFTPAAIILLTASLMEREILSQKRRTKHTPSSATSSSDVTQCFVWCRNWLPHQHDQEYHPFEMGEL